MEKVSQIAVSQLDYSRDNPPGDWEGLCSLAESFWLAQLCLYHLNLVKPQVIELSFPDPKDQPTLAVQKMENMVPLPDYGHTSVYLGRASFFVSRPGHTYDQTVILPPENGHSYYRRLVMPPSYLPSPELLPQTNEAPSSSFKLKCVILRLALGITKTSSYEDLYQAVTKSLADKLT